MIANNFASYSGLAEQGTKLINILLPWSSPFVFLICLEKDGSIGCFKFSRLAASDYSRIFKVNNRMTDDHTYLLLSGFVLGLLLDAPLILMHLKYGGYILGGLCIAGGIAAYFIVGKADKAARPA